MGELCELPWAVAATAGPLAGALIAGAGVGHGLFILAVMAACGLLFAGGSALDGCWEYRHDRRSRPNRVLPSGALKRWQAWGIAAGLLALGTALTRIPPSPTTEVGLILPAAIVINEILLGRAPLAVVAAGAARALSVLLGMSLVPLAASPGGVALRAWFMVVAGLYGIGVAVLESPGQAPGKRRRYLAAGGLICGAVVLLTCSPLVLPACGYSSLGLVWILLLAAGVGFRLTEAVLSPESADLDRVTVVIRLGFVMLCAGMVAKVRGPWASLAVLAVLAAAGWPELRKRAQRGS